MRAFHTTMKIRFRGVLVLCQTHLFQYYVSIRKSHDQQIVLFLQDLQIVHANLAGMEALSKLRESALHSLCRMVRYEKHCANDILYW